MRIIKLSSCALAFFAKLEARTQEKQIMQNLIVSGASIETKIPVYVDVDSEGALITAAQRDVLEARAGFAAQLD